MTTGHPSLSIVIPAYDEAAKIAVDVQAAVAFLVADDRPGEVIVVDDGSRDGTAAAVDACAVSSPRPVRCLRHDCNRGKGASVRDGILASTGDLVLFADAGLCVPFADARIGLALLASGQCELAHGSRRLADNSVVRPAPALRRLLSAVFRRSLPLLLPGGRHLSDTQCGFKLYRGGVARSLYAACRCDGWLFDLDVIAHALRRGLRIREFPVTWRCDPDSRVHPVRNLFRFVNEARQLRRRLRTMRSPEDHRCPIHPSPALP